MLNGSKDKRICFGWAKHVGSQNCNIFSRTLPGIIRLPVSLCSVFIYQYVLHGYGQSGRTEVHRLHTGR
jgi:hypothetical protein